MDPTTYFPNIFQQPTLILRDFQITLSKLEIKLHEAL